MRRCVISVEGILFYFIRRHTAIYTSYSLADIWAIEDRGAPMALFSVTLLSVKSLLPSFSKLIDNTSAGPCIGPMVAGWIGMYAGWRWICTSRNNFPLSPCSLINSLSRLDPLHLPRSRLHLHTIYPRDPCTCFAPSQSREAPQRYGRRSLLHT